MIKRYLAGLFLCTVLILTGCGNQKSGGGATPTPDNSVKYEREELLPLPMEELAEGETLQQTELQMNQQGEPALYQIRTDTDDLGEEYTSLIEYSLNSENVWQTKEFLKKNLGKWYQNYSDYIVEATNIVRGDDGNLYLLMKIYEEEMGYGKSDQKASARYSVLKVDETSDTFVETQLQTTVTNEQGEETDYAKEHEIIQFHVKEDGTLFCVFSCASAMWFDATSGMQINFCDSIADNAFGKRVGYGESEVVYYSVGKKRFTVLDSDTLSQTAEFGAEISEENRNYEWYFDVDTSQWQMYAFNQSGLYGISDFGRKASALRLSSQGDFDDLADADIYDVMVGNQQQVYVLLRYSQAGTENSEENGEYAVAKYIVKE